MLTVSSVGGMIPFTHPCPSTHFGTKQYVRTVAIYVCFRLETGSMIDTFRSCRGCPSWEGGDSILLYYVRIVHNFAVLSTPSIPYKLPLSPRHPSAFGPYASEEPRYVGSLLLGHFVGSCDRVSVQGGLGRPRREQTRQPLLFETPLEIDPATTSKGAPHQLKPI